MVEQNKGGGGEERGRRGGNRGCAAILLSVKIGGHPSLPPPPLTRQSENTADFNSWLRTIWCLVEDM